MSETLPALPAPVASTGSLRSAVTGAILPAQADTEARLVALWLHGRSQATQRAYRADLAAFRAVFFHSLRQLTLGELQDYQDTLNTLAPTTQARRLSAIKSLLSFGQRTGFLSVNVGAAIRPPKAKQTLSERILDVDAVLQLHRPRAPPPEPGAAAAALPRRPAHQRGVFAVRPRPRRARRQRSGHHFRQGRQNAGCAAEAVDLAGAGRLA